MNSHLIKIIFSLLLLCQVVLAGDMKLKAMGDLTIAVPDIDAQINLLQVAGNMAELKSNDSLNWMRVEAGSNSNWGKIKRHWDADKVEINSISFYGQKHIDENMVFFGKIDYVWDNRYGVNQSIEKTPYALDPFVLADSTNGSFLHYGPRVFVAFNQRLFSSFYWGASIGYYLSQGLKTRYTMPEIISREIYFSLDAVYEISPLVSLGLSYKPYHLQDNTKLDNLPDKTLPITYRYRGEYEFRKHVGGADRHAEYKGFELIPQISIQTNRLEAVIMGGYYYQWHELYDNPSRRLYDGYYQAQHYYVNTVLRYQMGSQKQTSLAVQLKYRTISNWAKHPENDLVFYEAEYTRYQLIGGFSHRFQNDPVEIAAEFHYSADDPNRKDYLAQVYRSGLIEQMQLRTGLEIGNGQPFYFRGGFIYHWFEEDPVWRYFGNYTGPEFTFGAGYHFDEFEISMLSRFGHVTSERFSDSDPIVKQRRLNVILQLKQYF